MGETTSDRWDATGNGSLAIVDDRVFAGDQALHVHTDENGVPVCFKDLKDDTEDVDDLQEIAKLEEYVEQSQCILIFLSRGYFFSTNCLREIDHALQLNKPLVLVHETDLSHGGAELETRLRVGDAAHAPAAYAIPAQSS